MGAKILGAITVGEGAIVAPGVVVTRDVPAHSTVMGIPALGGHRARPGDGRSAALDAPARVADLPDPVLELIRCMQEKIAELEGRLRSVEAGETPERASVHRLAGRGAGGGELSRLVGWAPMGETACAVPAADGEEERAQRASPSEREPGSDQD